MNRLFIAIPVDAVCQQQLDTLLLPLQNALPGARWQTNANRHITLAFLGVVAEAGVLCLQQRLPLVVAPFTLAFTVLGRFPDAQGRILAAQAEVSPPLLQLQQQVHALLQECGVSCADGELPLRPHITLARLPVLAPDALPDLPVLVPCQVQCAQLYVSEQVEGRRVYRVLAAPGET